MSASTHSTAPTTRWPPVLLIDLLLVLVFAVIGRMQHEQGVSTAGILTTAAPFLVACLAGWSVTRSWDAPLVLWTKGVLVWLVTVIGGLTLRGFLDDKPALSFQLVTLLVLGILLLGHRLIQRVIKRIRTPKRTADK